MTPTRIVLGGSATRIVEVGQELIVGQTVCGAVAVPLSNDDRVILGVNVCNSHGNTDNIRVGNEFGQYRTLTPGSSIYISISCLTTVYIVSETGDDVTIDYMAFG